MAHILLVEDEVNIASFIQRGLNEMGYETAVAYDGGDGWTLAQSSKFDLLVLDIILPKMNGLELCAKYRQTFGYHTPVIILTALGTTEDVVKGLEAGADDYIVKPFSFQELGARIMALLRRSSEVDAPEQLECSDLILNRRTRKVSRGAADIDLTIKEFRLLEYFLMHQGEAINRLALLKNVWDKNFDTNTNIVDVYVNYLRSKVDKNYETKLIHTVVGVGYMMEKPS